MKRLGVWIMIVVCAIGIVTLGVLGVLRDMSEVYIPCIAAHAGVLAAVVAKLKMLDSLVLAIGVPTIIGTTLLLSACGGRTPSINTACWPEVATDCYQCGEAIAKCVQTKEERE